MTDERVPGSMELILRLATSVKDWVQSLDGRVSRLEERMASLDRSYGGGEAEPRIQDVTVFDGLEVRPKPDLKTCPTCGKPLGLSRAEYQRRYRARSKSDGSD